MADAGGPERVDGRIQAARVRAVFWAACKVCRREQYLPERATDGTWWHVRLHSGGETAVYCRASKLRELVAKAKAAAPAIAP